MKEIKDFIEKAEKFLKTAEQALNIGDYDSCVSTIMRCFSWQKQHFLPRI